MKEQPSQRVGEGAAPERQPSRTDARAAARSHAAPPLRQFQQSFGNRFVGRLVQAKLSVSRPGDAHEREADQVADHVMRMADESAEAAPAISPLAGRPLQRACAQCDEEIEERARRAGEDEERHLQARSARGGAGPAAPAEAQVSVPKGGGEPLTESARAFFEPRFGRDFGHVRVHTDSQAAESARSVSALAYTVGSDLVFDSGQYAPESAEGRRLLAHELTHVVQQSALSHAGGGDTVLHRQSHGRCTEVSLSLPNGIAFNGDRGPIHASVTTNITPGEYTIRYETSRGQFVITPWPTSDVILNVSLSNVTRQTMDTFRAYRDSLAGTGVPLHVAQSAAGAGGPGATGAPEDRVRFNARVLSAAEFTALTGTTPDLLLEGTLVSGAAFQPPQTGLGAPVTGPQIPEQTAWPHVVGLPMALTRFPSYPIPPNATGIIWTQMGAGHLSVFSNVGGDVTARGFRYDMWRNLYPPSRSPAPGGFVNDFLFTLMPNQTLVYRAAQPDAAAAFAERLARTEYNQTYRFPPRSPDVAVCGSNCINVPRAEVVEALGVPPEILTPEGPVDITQAGRRQPGGPFEPSQAGRGATVREYLGQDPAYFRERGLTVTPVPNMTVAARGAVGFIKVGGTIFMIYGAYRTGERLGAAYGTEEFPEVVGEEAGSWAGGILGTALGGALGGAIFCLPAGPADLICVAGGFVGGLVVGGVGALGGSALGRTVVQGARMQGEIQMRNAEACESLPWYARGFCYAGSTPGPF